MFMVQVKCKNAKNEDSAKNSDFFTKQNYIIISCLKML